MKIRKVWEILFKSFSLFLMLLDIVMSLDGKHIYIVIKADEDILK